GGRGGGEYSGGLFEKFAAVHEHGCRPGLGKTQAPVMVHFGRADSSAQFSGPCKTGRGGQVQLGSAGVSAGSPAARRKWLRLVFNTAALRQNRTPRRYGGRSERSTERAQGYEGTEDHAAARKLAGPP